MKNEKYSILTNENSLHLMCVNARPECSLVKTFHDVSNVSVSQARTANNTLVLDLGIQADDAQEAVELVPTICELCRQVCDICRKSR